MDYDKLPINSYYSAKIKCTYVEIYILIKGEYIFAWSMQKKDFDKILGYGKTDAQKNASGLVPISLTDEALKTIDSLSGISKKIGLTPTFEFNPLSMINSVPCVYVKDSAIECELVNESDIEEEEFFVEKGNKDYSKLIWIALGAAALLL